MSGLATAASWRRTLEAVPIRNSAARLVERGEGELCLAVPVRRPRWMVPPISWVVPLAAERRVRLDRLGCEVWDLCDGRRSVEEMVDAFAARHALSFHEARVAVTGYLRELLRRGLLAVAMGQSATGDRKATG